MLATSRELFGPPNPELTKEHGLMKTLNPLKMTKGMTNLVHPRHIESTRNQLAVSDAALSVPFIPTALPSTPDPRWRRRPLQTSALFKQVET